MQKLIQICVEKQMINNILVFLIVINLMLCSSCAGGSHRRPALQQPVVQPQEYRQEEYGRDNPGSLFAASQQETLFADTRARRVGDIVIVKLIENTKAQSKAETSASKSNGSKYSVGSMFNQTKVGFIPFVGIGPQGDIGNDPLLQTSSGSNLKGTGKTKRENYVTTSLSARVLRELPGGLLEIEGAREIRVNDETEYMVVRGMIRSRDIDSDNSIYSNQIADASIEYYGKGVLADKQKPGWFTRLMDNIWPF